MAVFDWPWSAIHFTSGTIIGAILFFSAKIRGSWTPWVIGFSLLALWECVEVTLFFLDVHAHETIAPLKRAVSGFGFAPETTTNIIGDLLIGVAGLWTGQRIGRKL